MNLNKYTQKSLEALMAGKRLSEEFNHQTIEPSHLLLALLRQEDGVVPAIVMKIAGGVRALRQDVQQELENHPKVYGAGGELGLSRPAAQTHHPERASGPAGDGDALRQVPSRVYNKGRSRSRWPILQPGLKREWLTLPHNGMVSHNILDSI